MNIATSRWKSLIDTVHEIECYWRGTRGPIAGLVRTAATLGRVAEMHLWEQDDPYHWVKRQGYVRCFEKTDRFVLSVVREHLPASAWKTVYRAPDLSCTWLVEAADIGRMKIFVTTKLYPTGSRDVCADLYCDKIEIAEEAFREWWWESLEQAAFITPNRACYNVFKSHKMPLHIGEYVGPMDEEELHEQWLAYAQKGFHRSLLFIGPPGTGKSTVAKRLARRKGGPMMRLDPTLFEWGWDPSFVIDLMKLLSPSVLLLDDIHTLEKQSLSEMLHSIEWLNTANDTETLLIATANKMSSIDEALRRPGRFDESILFDSPRTAEARKEILQHYAKAYDCEKTLAPLLDKIAQSTDKITPAYLQELVKTVCALGHREDIEEVLVTKITTMAALVRRGNYWDDDEDRRMVEEGFAKAERDKTPRIGFSASYE